MSDPRDTRGQIQAVAMELFAEQGYDRTSLREIAERLRVTKAALYYHFNTKEEIAASFFEDYGRAVDELCDWAGRQPSGLESQKEILHRYCDLLQSHSQVIRFMHENRPALRKLDRETMFKDRLRRIHALLTTEDAPLLERLRAFDAIMTIHIAWFMHFADDADPRELSEAVLTISIDLIEANHR